MIKLAEVRVRPSNSLYYYLIDSNLEEELNSGDLIVIETEKGYDIGFFVQIKEVSQSKLTDKLFKIIRKADNIDYEEYNDLVKAEQLVVYEVKKIVKELKLEMKISLAHYSFDLESLTIFYEADGRVDFRELVKILNFKYNRKIELRQLGARDTAKLLGGIGPCGLTLCCSTYIGEFDVISIKMAKNQNLSLTPQKISGLCGKLLCCIKYEEEVYKDLKMTMPDYGSKVNTEKGIGTVIGLSVLSQKVKVKYDESEGINWHHINDINLLNKKHFKQGE